MKHVYVLTIFGSPSDNTTTEVYADLGAAKSRAEELAGYLEFEPPASAVASLAEFKEDSTYTLRLMRGSGAPLLQLEKLEVQ